ncbi:unnamed protein product [Malus baccata var. baccata]
MPLAPKPENFNPGDLSCSPSDLSRSPGQVLRLGVLPLSRNRQTTAQSSTLEVGYFRLHARTAVSTSARAAEEPCPVKLKSNKVNDDPLLAADIDELCKTQNQNATADVMDIAEFEE